MHPIDRNCFNDYIKKYPNNRFTCFEYNYDFRKIRNIISNSKYCITMKHHPIIFAMGENIPTISIAFSKYYEHKNIGALEQYGMQKYSINLEKDDYLIEFDKLFDELLINKNTIIKTINNKKIILEERKERFLKIIDNILNNYHQDNKK